MTSSLCPLCDSKKGIKHTCEVCNRQFCRKCCRHFVAQQTDPVKQVRTCDECYLKSTAWDATRSYDVFGQSGDKAVVLVHAALVGRHSLVLEAKALAEVGFRVIVPDLPAHGARFKEKPLTLETAVAALHDVLQQEAPGEKVVMMGFSMGGYITAAFAATYPELLAGVLLGGCCRDTHSLKWQLTGRLVQAVQALSSYRTRSQFIYKSCPKVMDPQRPEIQECFLRAGAECHAWRYTWKVMHEADMRRLLPKITCPALLVVGEHDFRDHEHKWLALLQHGGLVVLRDGVEQFMYQPGVSHEFRMNAEAFAVAAAWDPPPQRLSQEGSSSQHTADAATSSTEAQADPDPGNPEAVEQQGSPPELVPEAALHLNLEVAGEVHVHIQLASAAETKAGSLKASSQQQLEKQPQKLAAMPVLEEETAVAEAVPLAAPVPLALARKSRRVTSTGRGDVGASVVLGNVLSLLRPSRKQLRTGAAA